MLRSSFSEVVDAVLGEMAKDHSGADRLLLHLGRGPTPRDPSPSREVLEKLVETMFFASVATEEGRLSPVGIVYADTLEPFQRAEPAWDLVHLGAPVFFDVEHVAKLSPAAAFPASFLVVMPLGETLYIAGIATPHSRTWLDSGRDMLIRVISPRPGVVVLREGEWEMVRYERGTLHLRAPRLRPQMDAIEEHILQDYTAMLHHPIRDRILDIVDGMVSAARGGIVAILGPGEGLERLFDKEGDLLDKEAKRLHPPLNLGSAVYDMCEAQLVENDRDGKRFYYVNGELEERPPTFEEARIAQDAVKAKEHVDRMVDQIVRLTTVDGAVIMSHALEALAFGAKLPVKADLGGVYMIEPDQQRRPWHLEQRGTRHRAAACFVSKHPDRIAFVVSQDGAAASFQELGGNLCYWPF